MVMTDDTALAAARDTLDGLVLTEDDLTGSDRIVDQLAAFKARVGVIDDDSEPWVKAWLLQEHVKGAMLFTAAKTNRGHQGAADAPDSNPHSRANVIRRFNGWAAGVVEHVDEYVASTRTQSVVQGWLDRAKAFVADPLNTDN